MSGELNIQKFLFINEGGKPPAKKGCAPIDLEVTTVDIDQISDFKGFSGYTRENTPGYFVFSTAPFNVEDGRARLVVDLTPAMKKWGQEHPNQIDENYQPISDRPNLKLPIRQSNSNHQVDFKKGIDLIINDLVKASEHGTPELLIAIHGYSTEQTNVRRWYKRIFRSANQDPSLKERENLVFIGYRWSSERPSFSLENIWTALKALPIVLQLPTYFAGAFLVFWLVAAIVKLSSPVLTLALLVATFVVSIVASLVILRSIVYFRDNYRANNFAVPDLVELIRQLDEALQEKAPPVNVNLNFVAHSMGGFVATNAIRILSDVFDPTGVGRKRSEIGHVFCLKRLVLVAPDIPTLTIQSNRANFLASSLRRFDEAYLFSNEGDLALRLASTIANYFSFPARTRKSGYRLGNVTIAPGQNSGARSNYGIVNLETLKNHFSTIKNGDFRGLDTALNSLFVSNLRDGEPDSLADISVRNASNCDVREETFHAKSQVNKSHMTIADLFTYFDCTDYLELVDSSDTVISKFFEENEKYLKFVRKFKTLESYGLGILTRARGVESKKIKTLSVFDHTVLISDFIRGRDVHGGYFAAPFSRNLIYQLAFIGFHDLLLHCAPDPNEAIAKFNQDCEQHRLQILLSPLHYSSAYIQRNELEDIKEKLINEIMKSQE